MLFPLPFGMAPSEPGLRRCWKWYLPKRSLSSQWVSHSSLPSVCLLVAELKRHQEFDAETQSQYIAFLLIVTHHQLAQGLQEISPGQEASCPELSMNKKEDVGCQRKAPLTPSVRLGIPLGQAAPVPESSNDTCCTSELHPSAGWALLPTICSWLRTLLHLSRK